MLLKKALHSAFFYVHGLDRMSQGAMDGGATNAHGSGSLSQRARTAVRVFLLFFIGLASVSPALAIQALAVQALAVQALADQTCPSLPFDDEAEIRYIYDGDTLHLKDGRKVRLIGINTPELARDHKPAEPYAFAAKEALKTLFQKDKSIALVYGKDKKDRYGRLLAHAFLTDGQNVQTALLKQGFASAITYPPNTRFSACYLEAEKDARCSNRGLWENSTILAAKNLNKRHTGFHLVTGQVINIDINDKGIWLNLDDKLTVGIRPDNRSLFDLDAVNNLLNQSITVRGWINTSNSRKPGSNPFYLRVRHPSSIQLSSVFSCPQDSKMRGFERPGLQKQVSAKPLIFKR